MTRATVEDSTAGLRHPLRAGGPLVGGLLFDGVSGLCMSPLAHRLPGGVQAQGMSFVADASLGLALGDRTTACAPHVLGGDQYGEKRCPDLKHSTTQALEMEATRMLQAVNKYGEAEQRHEPKKFKHYLSIKRIMMLCVHKLKKLPNM